MSNKDLQRVTESVSYIGQAVSRRSLPARRHHITQKVNVARPRSLYLNVHVDEDPNEIFFWQTVGPLTKSSDQQRWA